VINRCLKPLTYFVKRKWTWTQSKKRPTKLLEAIGEDPKREGLLKTPSRVAHAYKEILAGYRTNPEELINDAFLLSVTMRWS